MWNNGPMRVSAFAALSCLLLASTLRGEAGVVARFSGDMMAVSTVADQVEGAQYSRQYVNPGVVSAAIGVQPFSSLYLGLRFENWIAGRTFTVNGATQTDSLAYQTFGLEAGYAAASPRLLYLATVAAVYPLQNKVTSTVGSTTDVYTPGAPRLAYDARMALAVRMTPILSVIIEVGYRFANLGPLNSGSFPYLGTQSLDLSGPFAGVGLGVTF